MNVLFATKMVTQKRAQNKSTILFATKMATRSSSREVRIRVPEFFAVVYFSRGTLPTKKGVKKGT